MQHLPKYIKGRGAQVNPQDPFAKNIHDTTYKYFVDPDDAEIRTKYLETHPKTIVNKVESPDVGMEYSLNPYQGCEHGCVYCYARNTHPYWGYSAGLDFESVILVKKNAPKLLSAKLRSKSWEGSPIMFSGNTDCYQPIEKKLKITRRLLQIMNQYHHPTGIVTKSQMILRDLDIIKEMSDRRLMKVAISLNTLQEDLRLKLEPRTASIKNRLKTIKALVDAGVPVTVLIAPIIPGLNDHEFFEMLETLHGLGVKSASYIMVRLNGDVAEIFADWVQKNFPDRAEKVLNRIAEVHGGKLNDSRFGTRMSGEGNYAESIRNQFHLAKRKFMKEEPKVEYDFTQYQRFKNPQMSLFE